MPAVPALGRRTRRRSSLLAVVLCAIVASCTSTDDDILGEEPQRSATASPRPTPTSRPTSAALAAAPVVLAISIDGLNPEAITTLGRRGAPTIWRLMDEGDSTLNARSSHELTLTLPNHSGMMTGRPVSGTDGTSVTVNRDGGGTLESTHGSYVAGMFDVAHDRGLTTALFAEKDKFRFLVRSWDRTHGARDVTGEDDGRDKLTDAVIEPSATLVGKVEETIAGHAARLVLWHVAAPDAAGHANGWLTEPYLAAVRDADRQVGQVIEAVERSGVDTTVIVTADHGGPRDVRQHEQADLLANYRIPFIVWSSDDTHEARDLYELNPRRRDPGTSRPDYTGPQPIRNIDVANTALGILDLPPVPGSREDPLVP